MPSRASNPMRIVVTGTSGSGKTTLARAIAARLDVPCVELDAINWQRGWRDLNRKDPDEFQRRAALAVEPDSWVVDGNYSVLNDIIWPRATHVVWLDYPRAVVMARVIARSVERAWSGRELWPGTGNREDWRAWLRPDHPIRWAWSTWRHRREVTLARLAEPDHAHLTVLRLHWPRDARMALDALAGTRHPAQIEGRA